MSPQYDWGYEECVAHTMSFGIRYGARRRNTGRDGERLGQVNAHPTPTWSKHLGHQDSEDW